VKASEIHAVVVGNEDEGGEERKKKTPEERAAEEAYQRDLDRRLREMIERYRAIKRGEASSSRGKLTPISCAPPAR
jgi:hypothetical protein